MNGQSPGPWVLQGYENDISEMGVRVVDAEGELVCNDEPYYPHPVSFANARLIASAPDLLAALERLERLVRILPPHMDMPDSALAQARAAIAKAKGEQA